MPNQLLSIINELRNSGIQVDFNGYGTAHLINKPVSFESHGKYTRIYYKGELFRELESPNNAIKYLKKF